MSNQAPLCWSAVLCGMTGGRKSRLHLFGTTEPLLLVSNSRGLLSLSMLRTEGQPGCPLQDLPGNDMLLCGFRKNAFCTLELVKVHTVKLSTHSKRENT